MSVLTVLLIIEAVVLWIAWRGIRSMKREGQ